MITDARVLEDDHLPKSIAHRDQEMNSVTDALAPIIRGAPAHTTLLTGPSGAGKTCIARFALDKLREQVLDLNHHYVDCWRDETRFKVLRSIVEGIDGLGTLPSSITSTTTVLERLESYDGPPIVVILDEADQLVDNTPLHDLARIHEVSLLLVANRDTEILATIDSRLTSHLHISRRVRFERYTLDELVVILEDRVEWGLEPGVVGSEELAHIADAAAGNARDAIVTLRLAAGEALDADADRIDHDMIDAAISNAATELRDTHLEQLADHQRALYSVLDDADDALSAGPIYQRYCERMANPVGKRMVRKHLNKLIDYNLVASTGANRGRTYQVVG